MKLKQIFTLTLPLVLLLTVSFSVSFSTEAIAFELPFGQPTSTNQSNQDLNKAGVLIAPEPDFEINVYPSPSTKKRRLGYGQGGDHVTVSEQVGSNEGYTWDYVKFEKSPQLKGWIRSDYVSFDNTSSAQKNTQEKKQGQNNYQSNQTKNNYRPTQGTYRNQ